MSNEEKQVIGLAHGKHQLLNVVEHSPVLEPKLPFHNFL